jgi:hypothetical protein
MKELLQEEITELLSVDGFETLHPDYCSSCKNREGFSRRIFAIPYFKANEEYSDKFVQETMRRKHNIEYTFIKRTDGLYYADSARCMKCGSTAVVYDVEITDTLIEKICKLTGETRESVLRGMGREEA